MAIFDVNKGVNNVNTTFPASKPHVVLNDVNDRMLVPSCFAHVQTKLQCKFEVDVCCDAKGRNSHCALYYSPQDSFLDVKNEVLGGKCLWINPPYDEVPSFLNKYEEIKAMYPSTSAAMCLPEWESTPWYAKMEGKYEKVITYPAKSFIFTKPSEDGQGRERLGPTKWPVNIR